MKNGFGRRFESLIRQRFQERDRHFLVHLAEVRRKRDRCGVLASSMTVVDMHTELEREFRESATECVKALADAMENRPTALLVPRKQKVLRLCSDALSERKADLDATFQGESASIVASLRGSGIIAPYRSLSASFVQLHCENACVELQTKQRELFWSKLLKLRAVLVFVVFVAGVAWGSYSKRAEIAEVWKSLRASVEGYFDSRHGAAGAGAARAHRGTSAPMPAMPKRHRRERAKARPSLVGVHTMRSGHRGRRPPGRDRFGAPPAMSGVPDRHRTPASGRPDLRRRLQKRALAAVAQPAPPGTLTRGGRR